MKIENVRVSELKPLEKNVRKHSDKQIEEMIRSVQQFGQTRAIVIDENVWEGKVQFQIFICISRF